MAVEHCVLLKGLFTSGGKEHQLQLSEVGLHWHVPSSKTGSTTGTDVPWVDIYGVTDKGETNPGSEKKQFTVHYISRKKDKKWRATEKKFEIKDGDMADWLTQIHARYRPGSPKSLLVIVNPVGGKGDGRQVYEKKVSNLFKIAGINTQVVYTERAKHAEEIINNFDFSKVDGLVTVGGDGMYQEAINTLLQRVQTQNGINMDNPENKVVPLENIKVGIIPAGTGNGISSWACGTFDTETAVLHIIRGETKMYNIFSIHSGGKLVTYSGFIFGYGFCSDLMKAAEEKRWMKRMRYPYVMLSKGLRKKTMYTADIEYLEAGTASPENSSEMSEGATAAVPDGKSWKKVESKEYMDLMTYVANLEPNGDKLDLNPMSDYTFFCMSDHCGLYAWLKFMLSVATCKKDAMEAAHITILHKVIGVKIKVKLKDDEASKAKKNDFLNYLDVDGEVYKIDNLEIDLRLHPRVIPLFSSETYSSSSIGQSV